MAQNMPFVRNVFCSLPLARQLVLLEFPSYDFRLHCNEFSSVNCQGADFYSGGVDTGWYPCVNTTSWTSIGVLEVDCAFVTSAPAVSH